jgi:hypothetical protein
LLPPANSNRQELQTDACKVIKIHVHLSVLRKTAHFNESEDGLLTATETLFNILENKLLLAGDRNDC